MKLIQPLALNDSIRLNQLAFVDTYTKDTQVNSRLNTLNIYLKNQGGSYHPVFYMRSTVPLESDDHIKINLLPERGLSESEILTEGMELTLDTNISPRGDEAVVTINDSIYLTGNIIARTMGTPPASIDTNTPSTLGGGYAGSFQVKDFSYSLTTEYTTIQDHFSLDEGEGLPLSTGNLSINLIANETPWVLSAFSDDVANVTYYRNIGDRRYELSNHLGNVLSVVSDKKLPSPRTLELGILDYFNPDIKAYNDYYPFGMLQPGRHANTPGTATASRGRRWMMRSRGRGIISTLRLGVMILEWGGFSLEILWKLNIHFIVLLLLVEIKS